MASEHEHEVVNRILDVREKVAGLTGPEAEDIRAAIEALIVVLARVGYTFPRTAA